MLVKRAEDLGQRIVRAIANVPILDNLLTFLEKSTGFSRIHVALGCTLCLAIIALSTNIASEAVGTLYPLYMSIKTIENKTVLNSMSLFHNLQVYWIIFFGLKMVESLLERTGILSLIPFYGLAKILFYVWCYHPTTRGSSIILNKVIRPYLTEHILNIFTFFEAYNKSTDENTAPGKYYLNCTLKRVQMPLERCVSLEIMIAESEDPDSKGFVYSTPELFGELLNFDYQIKKHSIISLNGFAELSLVEVPTFGANKRMGTVKFELSRLVAGAKAEIAHFSIGDTDIECVFALYKDV